VLERVLVRFDSVLFSLSLCFDTHNNQLVIFKSLQCHAHFVDIVKSIGQTACTQDYISRDDPDWLYNDTQDLLEIKKMNTFQSYLQGSRQSATSVPVSSKTGKGVNFCLSVRPLRCNPACGDTKQTLSATEDKTMHTSRRK
jgi:hypothetical protein